MLHIHGYDVIGSRTIAPNPKTNLNPNPNPKQGPFFLRGNCLVAPPTLKLTLTLTETPTLTKGQFSSDTNVMSTLMLKILGTSVCKPF